MKKNGLFVGLITGDLFYLATHMPGSNEKIVASDYCFTAGGPATNAAIAFNYCGSKAQLIGAIGTQPLGVLLRHEIETYGVKVMDIEPNCDQSPPISSIIVTESTGDRSVISLNINRLLSQLPTSGMRFLHDSNVVLIDGHQMQIGEAIAKQANKCGIPVVVDGGSWKPNFDAVLCRSDYVICSANFLPPGCENTGDVVDFLKNLGVGAIAITQGEKPILWWFDGQSGEIAVPPTKVVDTLGAGDIFHGAFCHYILQQDFVTALSSAAEVARYSCQFFGTRAWLTGR
ncbi:MAG: PfkB family carbohydrate kinase [Limnothrix sp.]